MPSCLRLAERHHGRGIRIADMHEGRAMSRMSQRLAFAGHGFLATDIVFRGNKVHQKYQNGEDWKRELAVQPGDLGVLPDRLCKRASCGINNG